MHVLPPSFLIDLLNPTCFRSVFEEVLSVCWNIVELSVLAHACRWSGHKLSAFGGCAVVVAGMFICCCWPHQWLMLMVLGLVSASCVWSSPHVPLQCLMPVLEWGYHPLIGAPAGLLGWPFLLWTVPGFSLVWHLPTRICISALASLCECKSLPLTPPCFWHRRCISRRWMRKFWPGSKRGQSVPDVLGVLELVGRQTPRVQQSEPFTS